MTVLSKAETTDKTLAKFFNKKLGKILLRDDLVNNVHRLAPDIVIVNKDGSMDIIEIVSTLSQTPEELKAKLTHIDDSLKASGIDTSKIRYRVYTPMQVFDKSPDLAKQYIKTKKHIKE